MQEGGGHRKRHLPSTPEQDGSLGMRGGGEALTEDKKATKFQ